MALCRLDRVGFDVGARLIELLSWRERALKRKPEVLDILRWVHSIAWPAVFGKTADDLQQAREVGGGPFLSLVCLPLEGLVGGAQVTPGEAGCALCFTSLPT